MLTLLRVDFRPYYVEANGVTRLSLTKSRKRSEEREVLKAERTNKQNRGREGAMAAVAQSHANHFTPPFRAPFITETGVASVKLTQRRGRK